ncbi:MAG: plasmid pRiA4b ORF-3 family protein, partial [Clostridiaceae bacterium]|nr:plasmid pRiA4b ORF-3 family protein [Clostridiaceae bacterium]
MIFALSNAVQERIKRDSSAGSGRSWTVLGADEAKEAAFTLLLQQADALTGSPVHKLEDWLQTEEGKKQALYDTRPDEKDSTTYQEADLFFVHIRKEEGRNILYFAHKASALTIGFQLGSHKLRNGRKSLLEIFYAGMRRLGYTADDLEAYFTHSPLSSFTTTGDSSSRSWMNKILSEYYFYSSQQFAGTRLLERDNFFYNENRTYLWCKKVSWYRPPIDICNDFFFEITGISPKRSIPAYSVRVRLLDEVEADQAENGGFLRSGQNRIFIEELTWRRFLVPSTVNCAELSEVIMACFGLLNYHRTKYVLREDPVS